MNLQQVVRPRSANGFGRRKVERETGTRVDNKLVSGKTTSSRLPTAGILSGDKGGGVESPSRERLVYLTTCLIGHHVEIQVIDGSIFSGIFHATNAAKDFGIILKMAHLTKVGLSRGQKNISDSVNKPPSKTLIIPARELVQILAKGVSVTRDGVVNEFQREKQQDIMTDSSISQSRYVELERELERWVPDEDGPDCPELDNIFDGPWNRGWDQFEANATLFGVKSTFNEDLYTTKIDRGPQMRELEREALRIAREIEGEDTTDLHLAEERGIQLDGHFDMDEETRFSSVFRGVNDSGYDEKENLSDSRNIESFGDIADSVISKSFSDFISGKSNEGAQERSSSSSVDDVKSSESLNGRELYRSVSDDNSQLLSSDHLSKSFLAFDGQSRIQDYQLNENLVESNFEKEESEKLIAAEEARASKTDDSDSSSRAKKDTSDKGGLSPNATAYAPPSSKGQEKNCPTDLSENAPSVKPHGTTPSAIARTRPGSSASSTSDHGNAVSVSSVPRLSPSSSVGSFSERSTLNPNAKEFKLNPNAKSFVPTQTPLRPASPVADNSFYYPTNMTAVPQMNGMPVGIGIGPSFGHQPVMFNPQAASMQSSQAFFHSNGPQYGQQMLLNQPRQVLYMPTYPPEMQYKGREF